MASSQLGLEEEVAEAVLELAVAADEAAAVQLVEGLEAAHLVARLRRWRRAAPAIASAPGVSAPRRAQSA